jgi:hypothetical protein
MDGVAAWYDDVTTMRLFAFAAVAIFLGPPALLLAETRLYFDPLLTTLAPGESALVRVRLLTDECVNAGKVVVSYDPTIVRAVDFSRGSSIFTLWPEEPMLNESAGIVSFSGGLPGGYCGRIAGDPVLTNTLGTIVFTAQKEGKTSLTFAEKAVYKSDGLGTEAEVVGDVAEIVVDPATPSFENPWAEAIANDTIPPEDFSADISSTRGVFDGRYYLVFSTLDKQSGISHYEIFEGGVWKNVSSPHLLKDQSLKEAIAVKAIDKAGNETIASYDPSLAPKREAPPYEYVLAILFLLIFLAGSSLMVYRLHKRPPPEGQSNS